MRPDRTDPGTAPQGTSTAAAAPDRLAALEEESRALRARLESTERELAEARRCRDDATERRAALERFRALAHEQQTILDAVSVSISMLRGRRFTWTNRAHTVMFGYSPEELQGRECRGHYASQEDYERVGREGYAQLARGEVYTTEVLMRRKSGERLWCSISGKALVPDRLEEGTIWALQDITLRKQAEASLRESERRLGRLVANSNDIIAIVDGEGRIQASWGPAMAVLGYSSGDLSGQGSLDLIHPDDREEARRALAATLARPGVARRVEFRFRHRGGNWVPVEAVGTSWMDDPNIQGVVLNIREITERKRAELERARLQEQLLQAMKMEAIGRLAGGVAHDFNNLLTVILGNIELSLAELGPGDPLRQNLAEIAAASGSASTLTRQLLAFSRRQVIEPRVLDVNHHLAELETMLHRLLGEDVVLDLALAPDLGCVRADPGQLEQVIVNLAVNARDAMPRGGRLRVQTTNVELDEAYARAHPELRPGRFVKMAVSDNGQGMAPEVKQHVFEPFFTTKPVGRGSGLGLATIFGIVQQAGGTIDVSSEVGQGTTFEVFLPLVEAAPERRERAADPVVVPQGTETILLAEDEQSVRVLTAAMLERLGYRLLVASNGEEAIRLAEESGAQVDLLLTDVVMQGMNGRELAERLRQRRPELPVLYVSGYTEDAIVRSGLISESLQLVGKPFTLRGLATRLRQVLDARPAVAVRR